MAASPRVLLACIAVVGLAACGDATGDAAPAGGAVDCDGRAGSTVTVDIGDFVFQPETISVRTCDSIVWRNTHDQAHTSTGNGESVWSTGNIAPGAESDPILFDTPGRLTYICALHPFMTGVAEVS